MTKNAHHESHRSERVGWLRAAVLGANDGIVSTASLVVGVAASQASAHAILVTGVAGLVAGSLSMAAGEYVSVSSQLDTEHADREREREELESDPKGEHAELTGIYVKRGLPQALASQVADELTRHDALGAHLREELGITKVNKARPVQAALASAGTFAAGALIPLVVAVLVAEGRALLPAVFITSLLSLAALGALAANAGGASPVKGALRVTFWGALAMAITAGVGTLFGAPV